MSGTTSILKVDPGASSTGSGTPPPEEPTTVSLYEKWRKIYPLWVSGGFQTARRVVLVILLGVFYLGPWLQWNGKPGVFFDLTHRQFTVFWTTFVPEEFVLLAWLLLIAALVLFTVTVAAGRVFCGWACPQTVWSLVYFTIEKWVEGDRNQRMRLDQGPWNAKRIRTKIIKYTLWAAVAFSISITFVGYFEPIRELFPKIVRFDLTGWEQFALLFPAVGSFLLSGVLREQVCFHMCPYARFQSVMFDHDSLIISYDEKRGDPRGSRRRSADPADLGLGSCIDCRKCVNVCPTGIDIRDGLQYQCIGCAACVDACTDVMTTMGYGESLVRYSSQNRDLGEPTRLLRPRLVGYASLIVVLFVAFTSVVSSRIPIGLDIARDRNRLYRQSWDDSVENVYTLRVENRDDVAHSYSVKFESGLPLAYEGPETVHIEPGKLASVPIRMILAGEMASEAFENEDVVFHIQAENKPEIEIEKTSRFHRP
ncbi:MAG: cytochrome c oxidase accessory protein CcoG [Myxococcota bacterium]